MRTGLALLLCTLLAAAAPAAARARTQADLTIRLISVTTAADVTDRAPKGASKGDKIRQASVLLNARPQFGRASGAQVGSDSGTTSFLSRTALRFDGVTRLPGGTLTVSGRATLRKDDATVLPVVRGTGRFAGARGTLTVLPSRTARTTNVYSLTLQAVI